MVVNSKNTKLLLNNIPSDLQKKLGILNIDANNCITFMNPPTDGISNWDHTKTLKNCSSTLSITPSFTQTITQTITPTITPTIPQTITQTITQTILQKIPSLPTPSPAPAGTNQCASNNFNLGGLCIPHIILYIIIGVLVLLVLVKFLKKR
jgi:carbohydrate-binding DOMON domain-containing protein